MLRNALKVRTHNPASVPRRRCQRFGISVLVLVATTVGACAGRDEAIGRRWVEALNSRDPDKVIRLLAPQATYTDPISPKPIPPPVLRTALENGWRVFKDRTYFANRILVHKDAVAIEWHIEQTSPSGKALPVDGVTVLDVRDGRIVAVRNYFDPSGYVREYLALLPKG